MMLRVPIHSSNRFSYDKDHREFVTEMSNFLSLKEQMSKGTDLVFSRIWDDACDVGFKIKSTKTGVEKLFFFVKELFSDNGEEKKFIGWFFESEDKFRVIILND